jgi:hypothetical protein
MRSVWLSRADLLIMRSSGRWHGPMKQYTHAFQITHLYGRGLEGKFIYPVQSLEYFPKLTVSHILHRGESLPVPPVFLEEWTLLSGGILKAPVYICAGDLLLC